MANGKNKRKKPRLDPYSGDQLADWFFRNFVFILNSVRVSKKDNLRNPNRYREKLDGLLLCEESEVFLEAKLPIGERLQTLVHECLHMMLPETRERKILQLEKIVWRRLTEDQRKILKSYLPKHKVKNVSAPSSATDKKH